MKRLLCAVMLALLVGGALGCKKEEAKKKAETETPPAEAQK